MSPRDVHRQKMGSSKKSHSGNCQRERKSCFLNSFISKMFPLSSQGPSLSQLLSKVLLQGSMYLKEPLKKPQRCVWFAIDNGGGGSPCPSHTLLAQMLKQSC